MYSNLQTLHFNIYNFHYFRFIYVYIWALINLKFNSCLKKQNIWYMCNMSFELEIIIDYVRECILFIIYVEKSHLYIIYN